MCRGRRQAIGKGASLFQARGYVRHESAILSAKAVSRAGERMAGPLPGGDKLVTRLPLRPAGPRFRQGSEPRPSSGRRQREEPHPSSGRDVQIAARSHAPQDTNPSRPPRWDLAYQVENPVPGNPRVAHGRLPAHLAPSGRCKSNGVRRLRGLARRIRSLASRLPIPQHVRQPSLGPEPRAFFPAVA